jgi:hypothetical protein
MNEWDELLEHIEEHKDDPIPYAKSCNNEPQDDMIWAELSKDPEAYVTRLMQTIWDVRLSTAIRTKARERLLHHMYGGHCERVG